MLKIESVLSSTSRSLLQSSSLLDKGRINEHALQGNALFDIFGLANTLKSFSCRLPGIKWLRLQQTNCHLTSFLARVALAVHLRERVDYSLVDPLYWACNTTVQPVSLLDWAGGLGIRKGHGSSPQEWKGQPHANLKQPQCVWQLRSMEDLHCGQLCITVTCWTEERKSWRVRKFI